MSTETLPLKKCYKLPPAKRYRVDDNTNTITITNADLNSSHTLPCPNDEVKEVTTETNNNSFTPLIPQKTPIEIFRLLIKSKFLTTQEIGELLLFVSKSLPLDIFQSPNEVWETLLISRFGHDVCALAQTQTIVPNSISNNSEILFRALLKGEVWPDKEPIRPLKYSPKDYHLILNVYPAKKGKKALFSKVLKGTEITSFFNNGSVDIDVIQLSFDDERDVENNWVVTIHMLRTTDQKCICLFQSEDAFSDFDYFFFYGRHLCLDMNGSDVVYSEQLLDELRKNNADVGSFEGVRFNVCLNSIVRGCCCGFCQPFSGIITSVRLEATLFGWHTTYDYPKKTNIKFAQILELLHAWEN